MTVRVQDVPLQAQPRSAVSSPESERHRVQLEGQDRLEFPGLLVDVRWGRVFRNGKEVLLTRTEFNLLAVLASQPRRAMSRRGLVRQAWGREGAAGERAVDVTIHALRRKLRLEQEPSYIHSIRGVGYRFAA
jgi:DNA-binding response OmpR family regulator